MTQMTLLVDMDGPLARFEEAVVSRILAEHPHIPVVAPENRTGFKLEVDYPEEFHTTLWEIMDAERFFLELEPVPGAIDAVKRLTEIYDVFFCTAPISTNPFCASEKLLWIEKYFGTDMARKVIITKDKTLIRGAFLVDDKDEITGSMDPEWRHLVYDLPSNQREGDDRFRGNWVQIERFLNSKAESGYYTRWS